VKGELEKKLNNMWSKKHKDLKQNEKHMIKHTAADLAAVHIIENWLVKKRN
jgi:hypothetical protein